MPDQKRVFIIHGWGGSPKSDWYPWLAKNLKSERFSVEVPEMPDTDNPKIKAWVLHLQKVVGQCDANTFFVGHSIGCQAIMRYLEKIPENEKALRRQGLSEQAGGAVFVAGWFKLSGLESDEERFTSSPWVSTPIDFEGVRNRAKKFICIFSDNDPYVPLDNTSLFSEKFGAEIIIEKSKGHFTGDDGVIELPVALDAVLKISRGEKNERREG